MKKLFITLFLIIFNFSFSQNYHFDLAVKYRVENSKTKNLISGITYFNTKNWTYYLKIIKYEERVIAVVFDYERNIEIAFDCEELSNKQIGNFKYNNTYSFSNQEINRKYSINRINDSNANIKLFFTKKIKKPYCELNLVFSSSNINLFPVFKFQMIDHPEMFSDLEFNENIAVIEANIGKNLHYKLLEKKDINLDISAP